jgi:hypothetical protein
MIPSLNEAVREYSDLQAEIVQHIYSEKYIFTNTECPECRGNPKKGTICKTCGGNGFINSKSPYGIYLVSPPKPGETVPTPPIDYVKKQTDIATLQDTRVKNHLIDALSSVNMEFLAETPLNQSGTAKEVDRDELNVFVSAIAEDIVAIMDNSYYFINEYRYSGVVPDAETRRDMLPAIQVPEKYNIMSESMIIAEITAARSASVNAEIIRALEVDYAKKKFFTNPEKSYMLDAIYKLDPLPGISEDEKMTRLSNGGITEIAYIISCNIVSFVQQAVFEDAEFYRRSFDSQKAKMIEFAKKVQEENSAANAARVLSEERDNRDFGDSGDSGDNNHDLL